MWTQHRKETLPSFVFRVEFLTGPVHVPRASFFLAAPEEVNELLYKRKIINLVAILKY